MTLWGVQSSMFMREAVKNYLADFSAKGGTSLPYPVAETHFVKKMEDVFVLNTVKN